VLFKRAAISSKKIWIEDIAGKWKAVRQERMLADPRDSCRFEKVCISAIVIVGISAERNLVKLLF
jgi:hypothetical protein